MMGCIAECTLYTIFPSSSFQTHENIDYFAGDYNLPAGGPPGGRPAKRGNYDFSAIMPAIIGTIMKFNKNDVVFLYNIKGS